jgi:hypothetical protein
MSQVFVVAQADLRSKIEIAPMILLTNSKIGFAR